jgi:quercetin dioxygenase-like cupin family protein
LCRTRRSSAWTNCPTCSSPVCQEFGRSRWSARRATRPAGAIASICRRAYLPPGTLGFKLKSATGARVLYFLDDIDPNAVIKTPLILESGMLDWQETEIEGLATKELRADPGTGARTWLLQIEPGAEIPWQSSTSNREGYFVAGNYTHTECVAGESATDVYYPGGYVYRPAHSINGGPESVAASTSIWFFRELSDSKETTHDKCEVSVTGY